MTAVLTADEVTGALREMPHWHGDPHGIERTFRSPEFLAGIRLVDAVAHAAEQADHHPDIDVRWRKVTFRLVTHSAGGVTSRDLDLARRIDELAEQHGCS